MNQKLSSDKKIKLGYKEAKKLTKNYAKSFYFASLFLSLKKRKAAYAIYALCRVSDHSVDNTAYFSRPEALSKVQERIESAYNNAIINDNLLLAFRETVEKYNIPKKYFDELLSGMRMDLKKNRYENFDELKKYCYKVAGVVGLIMLRILDDKIPDAEDCAVELGIAMQLTNILRDIKEDLELNRIYLPQDEMQLFEIDDELIKQNTVNNNFINFMKMQIKRARDLYLSSKEGIKKIKNLNSRLVIWLMAEIYAGILDKIEENQYNVFEKRAHLDTFEKISIFIDVLFRGKYL